MGLLDGLLGSLLGGLNNNQQNGLMSAVSGLVTNSGGIGGLMEKFNGHGLGDLVKGWVGTARIRRRPRGTSSRYSVPISSSRSRRRPGSIRARFPRTSRRSSRSSWTSSRPTASPSRAARCNRASHHFSRAALENFSATRRLTPLAFRSAVRLVRGAPRA